MIVPVVAAVLGWAAISNGFPLIFPDSGTYLGIAMGHEYALDRSSAYGLFLKPFVNIAGGMAGLWIALAAQLLSVAGVLIMTARNLVPGAGPLPLFGGIIAAALFTSLPWHAGQFMPDAFTGPVLLLGWLAASRDPRAPGAALLWLAAMAAALTHYTHLALLIGGTGTTIVVHAIMGGSVKSVLARAGAAAVAIAAVAGSLMAANAAVLGRASVSPAGALFVFARLHEDGLIPAWFDRHCGRDGPPELCAIRGTLPRDSQTLLWGGAATPLTGLIWHQRDNARLWHLMDQMGAANRGAIMEQPFAFLRSAAKGTLSQLVTFGAVDDECPVGCRDLVGGINFTLNKYRPDAVAVLQASRQVRDTTPKGLVRAVTTPVAWVALLLLPVGLALAWGRRDQAGLSLLAVVTTGLIANAALAGALSDVHDRYQSRVIWLVPLALLSIAWRWRTVRASTT